MNLELAESTSILRDGARAFLAAECPPSLVRTMAESATGHSPRLWQQMVDMGWPGIAVPEQYGGSGGGFLDLLVLMQEIGRAALPGPFFATAVLGGLSILDGGSEKQKSELLPPLCRGELLMSLALSEPTVDFGLDHLVTTAAATRGGRHLISGTKLFVPDAHLASLLICVAATREPGDGPHGSVRAFLVDANAPGVSVAPLNTNLHDRQFEVDFVDAQTSAHGSLGAPISAHVWLSRTLERTMVARCAEMVGTAQKVLDMTVEHARTRRQFDRPIGTLQAVQHHCANLATCVETAELMTYRAGWLIEQGLPSSAEALKAKAWTNEACKRAAALGHQVHGGIGFMREYDLHLYSTRLTSFANSLGGSDWCNERIALELFGPAPARNH
jgi:alkylation response protein AidB-like acyl-CoA dehydrogenase